MIRSIVAGLLFSVAFAANAHAQQMIGSCPVLPAKTSGTRRSTRCRSCRTRRRWSTPSARAAASTPTSAPGCGTADRSAFRSSPSRARRPSTRRRFSTDDESDPGPYAVPLNAPIEGGSNATGDRHAIAIDTTTASSTSCTARFRSHRAGPPTRARSSTCDSNALRPATWTSADAAGLPIMPGLVTYEEVLSGEIKHAIRFTVPQTRREFVWPARHYASSLTGTQYPRMGERFRLKASFDISAVSGGRAGDPARDEEIRHHPRRQRLGLVHLRQARLALEQRQPAHVLSSCSDRTSKRWTRPCCGSIRTPAQRCRTASRSTSARAIATVRVGHPQQFTATVTGAPASRHLERQRHRRRRCRRRHDRQQRASTRRRRSCRRPNVVTVRATAVRRRPPAATARSPSFLPVSITSVSPLDPAATSR